MDYEALKQVGEVYLETKSVKETADRCEISEVKARRILITIGLWSSESSERVGKLSEQGLSTAQIAEKLALSIKAVEAYLPYRRGAYGLDEKSAYALRSELYRERKKTAEVNMINRSGDQAPYSDEAYEKLRLKASEEPYPEAEVSRLAFEPRAVYHLRFELVNTDQLTDTEKKLAKAKKSISRDVLVNGHMNLHTLHYMIQRLFGWQNSHLHHFSLHQDDFDLVTAGRLGTYVDLCGALFRFPDDDAADKYWDDDYDDSVSVKTWLQTKYSSLRSNRSIGDTWVGNRVKLADFRKKHPHLTDAMFLSDVMEEIMFEQEFNHLSERITIRELFEMNPDRQDVREWKGRFVSSLHEAVKTWNAAIQEEMFDALTQLQQWRNGLSNLRYNMQIRPDETREMAKNQLGKTVKELIDEHKESIEGWSVELYPIFETYNASLTPYFHDIIYSYDYGDGWEVKISVVDIYEAKTGEVYADIDGLPAKDPEESGELVSGWESMFNEDNMLSAVRFFSNDGSEVDPDLRAKLAKVYLRHKPLCIAADGLNVLDDCGGVSGFTDMLKGIYGRDKDESADRRRQANSLGWTGRRTAPENML